MKYPQSSFWKNLDAARKFGDDEMVMDLVADQATDIALSRPDALNAALEHAGISVDKTNHEPKYLIGLVADNLHTNQKLIQNLALMIADKNGQLKDSGSYLHDPAAATPAPDAPASGGGDDKKSSGGGSGMTGGQTAGLVGNILSTVTGLTTTIMGAATGGKTAAAQNKGKMMDYLTAKENAKGTAAKEDAAAKTAASSNKTWLAIGLAVTVVGGLIGALYLMNREPSVPLPLKVG